MINKISRLVMMKPYSTNNITPVEREYGLNVDVMNVGHGGRQRIMHDSKMTKTCLREFVSGGLTILKVGDIII